jgi:glutathione peroxidase
LELLHRTYSDREFAVLGFPSDDFDHQDTGPSGDAKVCSTSNDTEVCSTANYDVQFPIFDKIVTKGVNQHPLYRYLTAMQPVAVSRPDSQLLGHLLRSGLLSKAPAHGELLWNFEKFLISRSGKVVARFAPDVTVDQDVILKAIEQQLKTPMKPRRRTGARGPHMASCVAHVHLLNQYTHSVVGQVKIPPTERTPTIASTQCRLPDVSVYSLTVRRLSREA